MMQTLRARLLHRACVDLGTEVPESVALRACQRVVAVSEQRCELLVAGEAGQGQVGGRTDVANLRENVFATARTPEHTGRA